MSAITTDCTQILYIPFHASIAIPKNGAVEKLINRALEIPEKTRGFKRLYWGKRLEDQILQIHIGAFPPSLTPLPPPMLKLTPPPVRDNLLNSKEWLDLPSYQTFLTILTPLTMGRPTIQHAYLAPYSPSCRALSHGSPITGTATYLSPRREAWDAAWARWQSIVAEVPGFMGIAGGPVVEDVDGARTSFVVFVGWESVEMHEKFHRSEGFRGVKHVLEEPVRGYVGYGHVCFRNENEEMGKGGSGVGERGVKL